MTEAPRNPAVLNTTVLSNFAQVDAVELLLTLPRVVTVDAVRRELEEGSETHSYLDVALEVFDNELPVVSPSAPARSTEEELCKTLDPGEAQALAVAEAADETVVTDDGDARDMANHRDIRLTGSTGLLVRFIDRGMLAEEVADDYLKRWIDEAGFRAPARDIDVFLEE